MEQRFKANGAVHYLSHVITKHTGITVVMTLIGLVAYECIAYFSRFFLGAHEGFRQITVERVKEFQAGNPFDAIHFTQEGLVSFGGWLLLALLVLSLAVYSMVKVALDLYDRGHAQLKGFFNLGSYLRFVAVYFFLTFLMLPEKVIANIFISSEFYFAILLRYGRMAGIGAFLFMAIAIFFIIRLYTYQQFIVDRKEGIVEAVIKSWRSTNGHFFELFKAIVIIKLCFALLLLVPMALQFILIGFQENISHVVNYYVTMLLYAAYLWLSVVLATYIYKKLA